MHDWVMVEWIKEEDSSSEHMIFHIATQLLLFTKLSGNVINGSTSPKVVAVIQSLDDYEPDPDFLLTFAAGDEILGEKILNCLLKVHCNGHDPDSQLNNRDNEQLHINM